MLVLTAAASGCGALPELSAQSDGDGGGENGGKGGEGGGNPDIVGGSSAGGNSGNSGNSGSGGVADPCAAQTCTADQHCEVSNDGTTAECVGNDCATLVCDEEQLCTPTTDGAICVDKCTGDVACPENQYCDLDTGGCKDDECVPGDQVCDGEAVLQCLPNGSGSEQQFVCASPAPGYPSQCTEPSGTEAECPCRDDWDCPAHTVCEAGKCEGTGAEPTCRLPAEPMENVLPANEITWGGTLADHLASNSPFPESGQVVLTPLVANLDDDNGDGLIDERDVPEIIFVTFCGTPGSNSPEFTYNGTLRAIHGGGPNKGGDFFATCNETSIWHEGDALDSVSCACGAKTATNSAILDSTASLAVGDLDNDGIPEIVGIHETDGIIIFDNTGNILSQSTGLTGGNPAPTLANLDNRGNAEIIIGRTVFTVGDDGSGTLVVLEKFEGAESKGTNGQGPVSCVANVVGDDQQEIIAGAAAYRFPNGPAGATKRTDCSGSETGDEEAWCDGKLITVWDENREGFCAIADVLGADTSLEAAPGPNNPLDGVPEVVLISSGHLRIYNAATGDELRDIDLGLGTGGPPNVDDFDGDGFPEIGTAGKDYYVVHDLQDFATECPEWGDVADNQTTAPRTPPAATCGQDSDCGDLSKFACNEETAQCVCLENGWRRTTQDGSSKVTGSSVFDFNGDGAAEVIYNDECFFRVYNGVDGHVYFTEPSESRTRIEYPIVADVDNDGNAEIVFATTNESGFCGNYGGDTSEYTGDEEADKNRSPRSLHNNGLEVWGDASDLWVSARRIWNQHAYHITNVTESGQIPLVEPPSWLPYNGRVYNSYRSNPRSFGVAPDLAVLGIQVSSPDAACGELSSLLNVTAEIKNIGDLRVSNFVVGFYGEWTAVPLTEALLDAGAAPITSTVTQTLEPGDVVFVTVSYDSANNAPGVLPDLVRVVVDDTDLARECEESNNAAEKEVAAGLELADLTLDVGAVAPSCPSPLVSAVVHNIGSAPANNYVVRLYAGDPSSAGTVLAEVTRPGPLAAGGSDAFDVTLTGFPKDRTITVFGVADPDNTIAECNDGNNSDAADNSVRCNSGPD